MHGKGSLTMGRAQTVGARIAAAEYHNPFACCENFIFRFHTLTGTSAILLVQEVHREVYPVQLPPRHVQIPWLFSASSQENRIEFSAHGRQRYVNPYVCIGLKVDSLLRQLFKPAVEYGFFQLEIRNPVTQTATWCPARFNCWAAARPEGPEPTIATRFPVRASGGWGRIQPSRKACSMMAFSICLMVTGGSMIPRTQEASHGAGQIRPVNSGKLLVTCSARIAPRQRPRYTKSFQSGMRLFKGHPE
jgi:hypothetical protein